MPVNTRYLELPDEIKEKISEEEFNKFRPIQDKLYKSDYNEFEERTRKLLNS